MNCPTCGEPANNSARLVTANSGIAAQNAPRRSHPKPLAGLATDLKAAAFALSMLLEGRVFGQRPD